MYRQMDIFDFIEEPTGEKEVKQQPDSLFSQMFIQVENPVLHCVNCLCRYCANNAEEVWHKVHPKEIQRPCFNCDDCGEYTGTGTDRKRIRQDCAGFIISEYGAGLKRNKIKLWKQSVCEED